MIFLKIQSCRGRQKVFTHIFYHYQKLGLFALTISRAYLQMGMIAQLQAFTNCWIKSIYGVGRVAEKIRVVGNIMFTNTRNLKTLSDQVILRLGKFPTRENP
jgi:hypothetical protein